MRVVLDTNVLVSGAGWPKGAPGKILDAWSERRLEAVVTEEIIQEYRRVLLDLAGKYGLNADRLLERIVTSAIWVTAARLTHSVCTDPNDDMFIAAAVAGQAKYIVSGDKALLAVRAHREVVIVTPAQLLSIIR